MSATDRAAFKSLSLSADQIDAIVRDTRLPGEIGYTYGISAAIVIRIQANAAKARRQRERADRAGRNLNQTPLNQKASKDASGHHADLDQ